MHAIHHLASSGEMVCNQVLIGTQRRFSDKIAEEIMSSAVWVRTETNFRAVKVTINADKDIDDLCRLLKDTTLSIELRDVGATHFGVRSPDSLSELSRDMAIRDIPVTTADRPLTVVTNGNEAVVSVSESMTTPSHQNAASSIANSPFPLQGFASLPSSFRFDATEGSAVRSVLCPTDSDITNVSEDMPLAGEFLDMVPRGEGESFGVNIIFSTSNSLFGTIANGITTLKELGADIGLATTQSQCDHLMMVGDSKIYGSIELKGGEFSPLQGNRQSAVYGSHFAMSLLKRGVSRERVIVPSYTYTGMQIQFGATLVLEPSLPVFWSTSKVLDMGDANERLLAVAYIRKAISWVDELSSFTALKAIPLVNMRFDSSLYHIKKITDLVARRGFQLFSVSLNFDISQGIEHWGRVLNLLYADPQIRPHVAFPLAIRSPNTSDGEREYIIIYNNLKREGYCTGCPDRMKDNELFEAFVKELRRIVDLVHLAGVIHCDLYLSNVMWRKNDADERVDIVIIDWDCAHCLIEGKFYPKILQALKDHIPTRTAQFGITFDLRYLDVLGMEYDESDSESWTDLASGVKEKIDNAFFGLFCQLPV